jgi:hypothetical protein
MPYFAVAVARLISVKSEVQLLPGPCQMPQALRCCAAFVVFRAGVRSWCPLRRSCPARPLGPAIKRAAHRVLVGTPVALQDCVVVLPPAEGAEIGEQIATPNVDVARGRCALETSSIATSRPTAFMDSQRRFGSALVRRNVWSSSRLIVPSSQPAGDTTRIGSAR